MTEDSPSSRTHGSLCSLSLCPPRHSSRGLSGRGRSLQREGRSLPQPRTGRALQCSESRSLLAEAPSQALLASSACTYSQPPCPLHCPWLFLVCAVLQGPLRKGLGGKAGSSEPPTRTPRRTSVQGEGAGCVRSRVRSPFALSLALSLLCLCLSVFLPLFSAPYREPPHPLLESPPDCSF